MVPTFSDEMTKSSHSANQHESIAIIPRESGKRQSGKSGIESATENSDPSNPADKKQIALPAEVSAEASWYNRQAQTRVPPLWLALLIAIPATIALGYSGYLFGAWYNKSGVVGCSGNLFDCDKVLSSKWSSWMGIPVSGLAMMNYILLVGALAIGQFGSLTNRKWMWSIVLFCGLSAFLAAIWFIAVQGILLNHWCRYCLFAHGCGVFIGLTLLISKPLGCGMNLRMGGLAALGLAVLAGGQIFSPESESDAETFIIESYDNLPPVFNGQSDQDADRSQSLDSDQDGEGSIFESPDVFEAPNVFEAPDIFEAPDFSLKHNFPGRTQRLSSRSLPSLVNWLAVAVAPTALLTYQDSEEESGQANQSSDDQPAQPPTERRLAEIRNGQIKLEINRWPNCGNDAAEYVVVEMFDYNCKSCRITHQAIREARKQMGDSLAVVALPVPLNTNCNNQVRQTMPQFFESCELSRLAVAVWRVDPEKFADFHNWMFEGTQPPSYNNALNHAKGLVDPQKLEETLSSNIPKAYIDKHVQLYQSVGGGTVPKLMFRSTAVVGEFSSGSSLQNMIKEHGKILVLPVAN